jgi:hypothetical protein
MTARRARSAEAGAVLVMTVGERSELLRIVRARERVAISEAREYEATIVAAFERKLAAIYKPKDHPIWEAAHAKVMAAVELAQAEMRASFQDLGIPYEWAPDLTVGWYGRGENASAQRRAELRHVAVTEAARRLRVAEAHIRRTAVETMERIQMSGLTSEAAREMLATLPKVEELMPQLDLEAIEALAAPDHSAEETEEEPPDDNAG